MIRKLYNIFNLHEGEANKEETLENIKQNISFSGPNLWILACAILIASVGLNMNSTAVVIGAMLISPLMGPIVASGFALGVFDFKLLKRALKNLFIATIVSLAVSTVYFYLSPFKTAQSELLSRTSPNIYDVLIAFFGGLAGVIAVTRKEKGNPIPGVAIATALMPPLCTAGYGLASGEFRYFFGALFLYCINSVFICISTYAVVKYMKYAPTKLINEKDQKNVRYGLSILILVLMIPSIYFAYRLYNRQKFQESVEKFVNIELIRNGETVLYKKSNYYSNPKTIEIALLDHRLDSAENKSLCNRLPSYNLTNTELIIKQDSYDELQKIKSSILNEIRNDGASNLQNDTRVSILENEIKKNNYDNLKFMKEANSLFPQLTLLSIANHEYFIKKDSSIRVPILIYKSKVALSNVDKLKLQNWTIEKFNLDTLVIIKE